MKHTAVLAAFVVAFLAASACSSSSSDGAGGDDASKTDCEVICKEAESVKCGGQACLDTCNDEAANTPASCKDEVDAYHACARKARSVSCSGGLLSHYGCSDLLAAFVQCNANGGSSASSSVSSSSAASTTASATASSVASSSTGGFVCVSSEAQGGLDCPDADPDNCVCYGCQAASCNDMVDCICPVCDGNSFCETHCMDDGVCNPFFENCACADCAGIPMCN